MSGHYILSIISAFGEMSTLWIHLPWVSARGRSGSDKSMDANGRRMLVTEYSEIPEDMWVTSPQLTGTGKGKARAVRKQRRTEED